MKFACKIMACSYYRDVVRALKNHIPPLLGYESSCCFFKDPKSKDSLFTVSVQEKDPNISRSLALAKELTFPEDQIVVFTTEMGISGEVFRKSHYKFENGLDKLVGAAGRAIDDASSTDQSLISRLRSLPAVSSRMKAQKSIRRRNDLAGQPLEDVAEDPQAEAEMYLRDVNSGSGLEDGLRMASIDSGGSGLQIRE